MSLHRDKISPLHLVLLVIIMSNPPHPPILNTGLQLKLQKQPVFVCEFSYGLFPTMEESVPVEWHVLTANISAKKPHIYIYQFQLGESLFKLFDELNHSHVKAVVFVNTDESYELPLDQVSNVKVVPFPVIIVKKSDGNNILKRLEEHKFVEAKVTAENLVDIVGDDSENQTETQNSSEYHIIACRCTLLHFKCI